MRKKIMFFLVALFVMPSIFPVAADSRVCGLDGAIYDSAAKAEEAGVDVSYNFACETPTDESKLYEAKSEAKFAGMLVEIGSTDMPTNLIVRDNKSGADYTVAVSAATLLGQKKGETTNLADWMPGDQIRVVGQKNENTGNIDAGTLVNASINLKTNAGVNGWITKINKEKKEVFYKWADKDGVFKYDDKTRFVAGLKAAAGIDDLKAGDRIRARLLPISGQAPTAKIVIVLRRGNDLFMKIRTFTPIVTLTRLDSAIIPTTIQVKMEKTPGIKAGDANNILGVDGSLITVNVTADTQLVRKYFGRTGLSEYAVGDRLRIVGRVNDDGTIDAKVIKNESIWKTNLQGHVGIVETVDAVGGQLTISWTPVKPVTRVKLREKLENAKTGKVKMQAERENGRSNKEKIADKLKARVDQLKEKVKEMAGKIGRFTREIKQKKVEIERIKSGNVKVKDLVNRLPAKSVKVMTDKNTKIVVGTNTNATLNDIKAGDKIRVRGIMRANTETILADTVTVVAALPEIEESEEAAIDDINQVVAEIKTDDAANSLVGDTVTETEEVIADNEDSGTAKNADAGGTTVSTTTEMAE